MKKLFYLRLIICLFVATVFASCVEEEGPVPLENNTRPPGQVANLKIENLKGKALLTYTLPEDIDLLYVKANYTLENGNEVEVKSSYFKNYMLLEGFRGSRENEIPVQIRSVNRSEVASEPVEVSVAPLPSPIFDVFQSITADPDFGGVRIKAINEDEVDLSILIMNKNDFGDWEPIPNSIYTSSYEIDQSIRGYDTIPVPFAIAVRDRWLNVTDTLFTEITPLYETLIPISGYRALRLANDQPPYPENRVEYMWDGQFFWPNVWLTLRSDPTENHTVTVDMGTAAKLSRVKMWQYPEWVGGVQTYYYLGSMRLFRIWGTNETPDPAGSFDGWTLLGEYEVAKPSGLPYGQQSNEDVLTATAGEDFEISFDAPPVRYIRIQNLENFAGLESLAIAEMLMYGDPDFK